MADKNCHGWAQISTLNSGVKVRNSRLGQGVERQIKPRRAVWVNISCSCAHCCPLCDPCSPHSSTMTWMWQQLLQEPVPSWWSCSPSAPSGCSALPSASCPRQPWAAWAPSPAPGKKHPCSLTCWRRLVLLPGSTLHSLCAWSMTCPWTWRCCSCALQEKVREVRPVSPDQTHHHHPVQAVGPPVPSVVWPCFSWKHSFWPRNVI